VSPKALSLIFEVNIKSGHELYVLNSNAILLVMRNISWSAGALLQSVSSRCVGAPAPEWAHER
jgi:hypothetical protein